MFIILGSTSTIVLNSTEFLGVLWDYTAPLASFIIGPPYAPRPITFRVYFVFLTPMGNPCVLKLINYLLTTISFFFLQYHFCLSLIAFASQHLQL